MTDSRTSWIIHLDEREKKLLKACEDYANNHAESGLPGHSLMMLVSKLASILDDEIGRKFGPHTMDMMLDVNVDDLFGS